MDGCPVSETRTPRLGALSGDCSLRSGQMGVDSAALYGMGPSYTSLWRQVRVPGSGSRGRQNPGPGLLLMLSESLPVLLFEHLAGLSRSEHSGGQAS